MSFEQFEEGKDNQTSLSRPSRLQALFYLVLGFIFFFGCVATLGGLATYVGYYYVTDTFPNQGELKLVFSVMKPYPMLLKVYTFFASSLPLIAAALLTCVFIKATPTDYLSLRVPQRAKWFVLSLLFVFLCVPLMGFMLDINQFIDFSKWPELHRWLQAQDANNISTYEAMLGDKNALSIISSILFMALAPAIAEEIFFRGFLMNTFNGIFKNMHVAILVTALLFSLIHVQFTKFIPMFFLAVVFGYAAYWSGTIWTSIAAHFINNALAVVQLYFFTNGDYSKAIEQGASIHWGVNLLLLVAATLMFVFIQKNANPKIQNFYV